MTIRNNSFCPRSVFFLRFFCKLSMPYINFTGRNLFLFNELTLIFMRKKKALLTLLCCVSLTAYADGTDDTNVNSLVVWTKDGKNVAYALEKLPKVEFGETSLRLTCGTEDVTYLFDDTDRITYTSTDLSGIADVKGADKRMFVVGERSIYFPAIGEHRAVGLYDASGKLRLSLSVRKGETYSLPRSITKT